MTLSVQFFSLLAMIGTGIVAAAVVDGVTISLQQLKPASKIKKYSFLMEWLAWIVVGGLAFYVLYLVRDGGWRIYDPFAQVCGLLLYVSFFHRPFRFVGTLFLILFIKPIGFVFLTLFLFLRFILKVVVNIFLLITSPFRSFYKKFKKYLLN